MNQRLKQEIINFIRDNCLFDLKEEKIIKTEVNSGVTKDGLYYDKEKVLKYMSDNYYEFTEDNLEFIARKFLVENDKVVKEEKITVDSNLLETFGDDDIQIYMEFNLLKEIIKANKNKEKTKQYKIEIIRDNFTGSVDIYSLSEIINTYSNKGWTLAHIFSNELGKEGASIGIGGVVGGTNATIDEIVLIFEKNI